MNNKASGIQTISVKRANSKAQISRYLSKNQNKLPEEIILNWQNLEEIEEILNNKIKIDLKRINSTVGKTVKKRKDSDSVWFDCLMFIPILSLAFIVRLLEPKMLILNECSHNIEECQLRNNQKQ